MGSRDIRGPTNRQLIDALKSGSKRKTSKQVPNKMVKSNRVIKGK